MHKTLRGTLASHSTQGSHSKGLNHGFWGLHARFNLKTAGLPVSSHPPTRTGWVPTTVMRHALAAFDTPPRRLFRLSHLSA